LDGSITSNMAIVPTTNGSISAFASNPTQLILDISGYFVPSTASAPVDEWTWMGGANVINQKGTYGTQGTAAPGNVPGARGESGWTDANGNLWLFGGLGFDSAGSYGILSDLWEYSAGQWTWTGGANVISQKGTYGTQGTAAPGNVPGARTFPASWVDTAGNFWLFGGVGYDSTGTVGRLNDLWKYSTSTRQWTWMGGANVISQKGTYGTQATAAPGNVPGARDLQATWTDAAGNFWLFGGSGYDSAGTYGSLNDLWKYSPSTSEWTWMGGSNVVNQNGMYGTQGTAAAGNVPGALNQAASWTDASGNLWLFGGLGLAEEVLNDLWKYSTSTGLWTWMSGSTLTDQRGTYGTQGTAAASNIPGSRDGVVGWTDTSGNFWLFGGFGYDSTGTSGSLNDLWKYSTNTGLWTWMGGSNVVNQPGTYGTQGTPAPGNVPGARTFPPSWTDATGNFWLFGGDGSTGVLNDLWKYVP
jgi:N-acetylneuraminic acid mutarotase